MRKILAKDLKLKFVETLNEIESFSYKDGNPFLIQIHEKEFFVFLKNISSAYFKKSPDITRVQLPFSEHFNEIFKAKIPFIILGYDVENDSMVSWNPGKIKDRLNAKNNVSLYSRHSLQSNFEKNKFNSGFLKNGEKIIIFSRTKLEQFFKILPELFEFNNYENNNKKNEVNESKLKLNPGKIVEVTDFKLLNTINPVIENNRVLEAVELCMKYYENEFKEMTFKDWFKIVNNLYKKSKFDK
ncbi:hypothetical protein [Polaribacter sp. SA4-12]|uniref:hypothetical protein n=1 Tax=Polaribacter sp. SA4-12 TaxID=1312072 RepID=UPI000B3CA001|nr:hypothetical protein [Polaribacter sp. SA4-12]ARV14963.1 hypothetical protein BTO07_07290 [Polaribacter sp. SA4-12]